MVAVVHAGEVLVHVVGGSLVPVVHAGETLVLVCHLPSYAMPDLDHTKVTALQVGYHSHPSSGVLACLDQWTNDGGGQKMRKRTEDVCNVYSHIMKYVT